MDKICDTCGNHYDNSLDIAFNSKKCYECAMNALAPSCRFCESKIVGHRIEENNLNSYCAYCNR